MSFIDIKTENGIALVTLARGRSNPINSALTKEVCAVFKDLEADGKVRGVILTGQPGFFSAGVDLIEAYALDEEGIKSFWLSFMEMTKTMWNFSKPLVAAVSGHAPAGGCVMSLCADYSVMAEGKFSIGLNEIPVGIIVPDTIFEVYAFRLGRRQAYQNLLEGKLLRPEAALAQGLVDKVAAGEQLIAEAQSQLSKYISQDANTWSKSKLRMRAEVAKYFEQDFDTSFADILEQWWSPQTRAILKQIVDSLTKK